MICERDGQEIEIDSRTSDALALAVRFNCPIFTYEFILDSAGAIINEPESEEEEDDELESSLEALQEAATQHDDLSEMSVKDLNDRLKDFLDQEDYESAARVRDEIERRKGS